MPKPGVQRSTPLRGMLLVAGVGASATFLWLSLRNTDLAEIRLALLTADLVWIVPFLIVLLAFYWLKTRRWRDLLSRSRSLRTSELFPAVMIGYAGTAVLPMQMGELVRAYIVSRKQSISYATVLGSIGIERLFDFLAVLALLGFVLISGQNIPEIMKTAGYLVAAGCLAAIVMTVLLVMRPGVVLQLFRLFTRWLPDTIERQVLEQLQHFSESFQILRQPRILLAVASNSVLQWLLMGVCILFSLWAFDLSVPPSGAAMVLIATIIGISLPTSPGYIGNIQLAFTLALSAYGVSPADAVAASIYYHVLAYVTVVVVGFFFLHRYGYALGELRREAAETQH